MLRVIVVVGISGLFAFAVSASMNWYFSKEEKEN